MSAIKTAISWMRTKSVFIYQKDAETASEIADQAESELSALQARVEALEAENNTMYSTILEASTMGISAPMRCKVELQRIAKNEAILKGEK